MLYRSKLKCSKLNVTGVACISVVHVVILIAWYEELRNSSDLKIKDIHAKVDLDVILTRARPSSMI